METKELEKLKEIRDSAAAKIQQADADAAKFDDWPHPVPKAVLALRDQLTQTRACWKDVQDWAAQAIRSDIEKELM